MSWLLEALVRAAARRAPTSATPPAEPRSIFVLRNNDVGDLLVVTPLFEALRRRFPSAHLAAGVGSWNLDVLRHNPHVSEVLPVNAPWFNKYQAAKGPWERLTYVRESPEVKAIAERRFEIGIDVLGSAWGSLLLLAAGIPFRMGVRGYAGGHSAVQVALPFDPGLHVGRSALRFAERLGATELPECRPQIFLTGEEREAAEGAWSAAQRPGPRPWRIVVGPGGGLPEKLWPTSGWAELVAHMEGLGNVFILVLGGPGEAATVGAVAAASPWAWAPPTAPTLREAFALVAAADLLLCNSSMLMHAAAAFSKPTLVLLGRSFPSAAGHQAQWGYATCRSLGREPGFRSGIVSPGEALAAVREASRRWE